MYAVNLLSQFLSNTGIKYWSNLLKLLDYLQYIKDFKLKLSRINYSRIFQDKVSCYSDLDFAANSNDCVSIGGYILFLDESSVSCKVFNKDA